MWFFLSFFYFFSSFWSSFFSSAFTYIDTSVHTNTTAFNKPASREPCWLQAHIVESFGWTFSTAHTDNFSWKENRVSFFHWQFVFRSWLRCASCQCQRRGKKIPLHGRIELDFNNNAVYLFFKLNFSVIDSVRKVSGVCFRSSSLAIDITCVGRSTKREVHTNFSCKKRFPVRSVFFLHFIRLRSSNLVFYPFFLFLSWLLWWSVWLLWWIIYTVQEVGVTE